MSASQTNSEQMQTLSLKLPAKAHSAVKRRATAAGVKMSDYYVELIERFIQMSLPSNPPIISYPIGAVSVSVVAPVETVQRFREIAEDYACTIQLLAMTAVDEHLYGRLIRAA